MTAVGPVGTVKKPSVVGEFFSKPPWESAFCAAFQQWRPFPPAFFLFPCFCFRPRFPQKIWLQDRLGTTISNSVDR